MDRNTINERTAARPAKIGRRVMGALAATTAMIGAAPVAGQSAPGGGRNFVVNASVDTLYDSNVVRSSNLSIFNQQSHQGDYRVSPSVSATYERNSGRIALAVDGLVGYDFFRYNKYLNNNRYVGGGSLTYHRGASCQLAVTGNVSSRQDTIRDFGSDIIDPSVPIDSAGTVIDNVTTAATYGSNFSCGSPTGRLTFGGAYSHNTVSNASQLRKFGDSTNDTYSGNVGIGILRPGQLTVNGSYSTIAYPNRFAGAGFGNIPPQLLNSGVASYRIGVTLSRPIGNRLSGRIGASYLHANPSGGQAAYSSPAYTLGLTYTPTPRISASLTGSRDISPSTTVGALYSVTDQVQLVARYTLGRTVFVSANAGLTKNNFKQSFATFGEVARDNDTTTTYGAGVSYRPRSFYDINFNVSRSIRRSKPAIFDYSGTRVGFTVAAHI